MKTTELREKEVTELQNIIQDKKLELCQLRFDVQANQAPNNQRIKLLKREIARILTIIRAK